MLVASGYPLFTPGILGILEYTVEWSKANDACNPLKLEWSKANDACNPLKLLRVPYFSW